MSDVIALQAIKPHRAQPADGLGVDFSDLDRARRAAVPAVPVDF
jgi:hypothetical protein